MLLNKAHARNLIYYISFSDFCLCKILLPFKPRTVHITISELPDHLMSKNNNIINPGFNESVSAHKD